MLRPNLNLARKWRSRTFDEIVGQELSVRVLKNSLYLNQYFPVYLFSGQRGCGKTSTARIFASALNCQALATFQKDPKSQTIPCLLCASCNAMQRGQHPDFIEIDAASHTGVDNVRQIIDAASLLPVLGSKKIYLIDEAHMLSKAAFNALLKILEEPPISVIFILATTDVHKIIETVKSRCFQLLFKPIETQPLLKHLEDVCNQESIKYESEALTLIIKESDGSARDALNALEQIRLSYERVTVSAVHELFGNVDDATIIELLEAVLLKTPPDVLHLWQKNNLDHVSASYLYYAVRNAMRALIWHQYNQSCGEFVAYQEQFDVLAAGYDAVQLTQVLQFLYEQELLLVRLTDQQSFVQNLLLQLCQKKTSDALSASILRYDFADAKSLRIHAGGLPSTTSIDQRSISNVSQPENNHKNSPCTSSVDQRSMYREVNQNWDQFLHAIDKLYDPLLSSIFKQAKFVAFDSEKKKIQLAFAKESTFFTDWLADTKKVWEPFLCAVFGVGVTFDIILDQSIKIVEQPVAKTVKIEVPKPVQVQQASPQPYQQRYAQQQKQTFQKREFKKDSIIDVSDKQAWAKTHIVLQHFPGIVCKEGEGIS